MNFLQQMKSIRSLNFSFLVILLLSNSSVAQQATLNGNVINIPVVIIGEQAFQVELTLVADTNPIELLVTNGVLLTDFNTEGASTFDGNILAVPSLDVDGIAFFANFSLMSEEPPAFVLVDAGTVDEPPPACVRPEPDPSHGPDDPPIIAGWSIDRQYLISALAPDQIPAVDNPVFTQQFSSQIISDNTRVIGVKIGDDVRAYSHTVMDWHEIVNDEYLIDGQIRPVTLSYCPLTGSAVLWKGNMDSVDPTWGVSGALYNSNLVMYDRETGSYWAQMLEQGIMSEARLTIPERLQVIETTWGTWREMYPQTSLLSTDTGFPSKPYGFYPYGSYQTNNLIIPPPEVVKLEDGRLHRKERVLGINVGTSSKVYPISSFGSDVTVINDRVGIMDVVATGSSTKNFAAIFNRQLEDCTVLEFTAVQDQLPIVMTDNEGNEWDIFGTAVSGPRAGTQLAKTNSYIAFWFGWAAFFAGAEIYQ